MRVVWARAVRELTEESDLQTKSGLEKEYSSVAAIEVAREGQ